MKNIVQSEYDSLEEIAQKFYGQAENIDDMRRDISGKFYPLIQDGWIGGGADAFNAEMHDEVLPAVRRLIDALEEACSTTRKVIRVLAEAEDESARQFTIR